MSGHNSSTPENAPTHRARLVLPTAARSGRAGRTTAVDRATHHLEGHRTGLKRVLGGFAAVAVVGASLSLTAAPGEAVGQPQAAAKKPGFAGYSSTANGSPLKIEVYEPTIPLPAEPQLELSVGYTAVLADSASSRSRASYLWPGAPVGEGFKTIAEQLGLPAEIGAQGYPIQVNAIFPGDKTEEADEPLPGMIQRASAGDGVARADNGVSTDGATKDDDAGSGDDGPIPGLPGLPGLPVPGLSGLTDTLTEALTGKTTSTTAAGTKDDAAKAPAAAPGLPDPLSALVDVGALSSTSRTDNKSTATASSRAAAADITLLGGLVTIEGIKTTASASSDGAKGTAVGRAAIGDVIVAGQRFSYGSDGFEAAGTTLPIPGLPAQGAALLEQLGLKISVPKPVYTKEGDAVSTYMAGLVIDFDLKVLKKQLGPLTDALNMVLSQFPEQAAPLTSALQAVVGLGPRVVVYLGTSYAGVDTSQAIVPPPIPTPEVPDTPGTTDPAPGGGGDTGDTGDVIPTIDPPADPTAPVGDAPTGDEAVSPEITQTAAVPGLPPLLSFPGLLLYGGILGAAVAGFFVKRLGALALGSAGSCPHGLTSGLPDLRKV